MGSDGSRLKSRPFMQRLGFARQGIAAAWRSEASFRWQALAAAALLAVLVALRPAALWWAVLVPLAALVLAAELFNTALERVIDRLHPEYHRELEIAKDCAAGAVLVLAAGSAVAFAAFLVDALR